MHKALQIPELLENILEFVPQDALPAVARTCRYFFLPAITILFKSLSGLSFIRFIEAFCEANDQTPRLHRWPADTLERLQLYASRVKAFTMVHDTAEDRQHEIACKVTHHLHSMRRLISPEPIFPRLRKVSYWTWQPVHLNTATLFFGPTLQELVVCVGAESQGESSLCWANLLSALSEQCPQLRDCNLVVKLMTSASAFVTCLTTAIPTLRRVHCFGCGTATLNPDVLTSLAILPLLEQLYVNGEDHPYTIPQDLFQYIEKPFPVLHRLQISGLTFDTSSHLLELLPPTIDVLTVHCSVSLYGKENWSLEEPDMQEMEDFMATILQRCRGLRQLEIRLMGDLPGMYESDDLEDDGDGDILNWERFSPLLFCKHVEHFKLRNDTSYPLNVRDSDIEGLAKAWPKLVSLDLTLQQTQSIKSTFTIAALGLLARHCPRIEHIGLSYLETHTIPSPSISPTLHHPLHLSFPKSTIRNTREIGSYLASLSPSLTIALEIGLHLEESGVFLVDSDDEEADSSWKEVLASIRSTRRARSTQPTLSSGSSSDFPPDKLIGLDQ